MLQLKELRERNKLSQQDVADFLGCSRSTVAMWETEKSQPDNNSLVLLADKFNCTIDYLLGRTDISANENTSETDKEFMQLLSKVSDDDKRWLIGFIKSVLDKTIGQ